MIIPGRNVVLYYVKDDPDYHNSVVEDLLNTEDDEDSNKVEGGNPRNKAIILYKF